VIIIGAGPAGLAAALQLSQSNHVSCVVYEIRSEPTTLGGAVGIPSNGLRLFHRLGLYESLAARGAVGSSLAVHSSTGSDLGEINLTGWSKEKTGFGYMRIKRTDLVDILLTSVEKERIPIYYSKQLVAIKDGNQGVIVTFSDGTVDTADLLLGCDGIHSCVRTMHVDPGVKPEYRGLSGIFSLIPTDELSSTASSVTGLNATLTKDGLFAVMPCSPSHDNLYWFFSYPVEIPLSGDNRDGWEVHRKKEIEGFKSHLLTVLRDVQGSWGDFVKEVVEKTKVVKFYPTFSLPLGGKWSKGRCLLLGDAGHAMQPHAGQGVSMALEDVFLLSRLLGSPSLSLPDALLKFDQIRRPRVDKMYKTSARNGERRKKTGPWSQWFTEWTVWVGIYTYNLLNLYRWGLGQKDLVYDIDEEVL
jgi:2-polyprenyl-6-methoxyphenol hydroxylase-like FAD-dependent oxidoreductase